jgi:TPR repeat protein
VPQNITRGVELTRLAAERGMTVAKCNLGVMLLSGEDCVTDFVGARQWLQAAHDEGDDLASLALAPLLAQGLGGPRDLERARSYLRRLANRGNVAAIRLLASIET